MQRRRIIAVCALVLLVGSSSLSLFAQDKKAPAPPKLTKEEQQDAQALDKLVNAISAGQPAPAQVTVAWQQEHFLKLAPGLTYSIFTVGVTGQSAAPVTMYVRAMPKGSVGSDKDKDKKVAYPAEEIYFFDIPADARVSRAVNVPPGDYDLYVAVKDKATGKKNEASKAGVLKKTLTIPDLSGTTLSTSSVILATGVEGSAALPPDQARLNPYTLGGIKITPANPEAKFSTAGELALLFWIYGETPVGAKPDVQIEYNFHQRLADGEKYFNKTAPQALNGQTLPPDFDLNSGALLMASQSLPLKSFPPGNYRLEIKITDKPSGKTVTQSVNFTVTA